MQIGPGIVLIGAVVYVFSNASTPVAVAFLAWCIFVGLLDNFLKPLLLGRGVRVPMLVIFVGAIGGVLTSGIIGQVFGPRHMSMLYGIVFLSHQVGSFIGAWWAGQVFDATGSYDAVWLVSIALGILAAILHLPIRERPLARTAAA